MAFPGLLCTNRLSSVEYHTWKIGPITTVPMAAMRAVLTTSCSRNGTFSTYCCAIKSPAPRRAPANKSGVSCDCILQVGNYLNSFYPVIAQSLKRHTFLNPCVNIQNLLARSHHLLLFQLGECRKGKKSTAVSSVRTETNYNTNLFRITLLIYAYL